MVSLADLHEKRVAIVLWRDGETVVLTGMGASNDDATLGRVLRVELDDEDHPMDKTTLIIPEADIEKLVHRHSVHGCDYLITIE